MQYKRYLLVLLTLLILQGCGDSEVASPSSTEAGAGGSTARFTIGGDYLYTIDGSRLRVFDISTAGAPGSVTVAEVGLDIETIFARGNYLFIGSRSGMFIYDRSNPLSLELLSEFWHAYSCDPVVADERYAYVTLRSDGNACGNFSNELRVIDLVDIRKPEFIRSYPMSSPKGLGIDSNLLFVCDKGLKVFNASKPDSLRLLHTYAMTANDVIVRQHKLIVTAEDALYQYEYQDTTLKFLSKLSVSR